MASKDKTDNKLKENVSAVLSISLQESWLSSLNMPFWDEFARRMDLFYERLLQRKPTVLMRYLMACVFAALALLVRLAIAPENAGLQFVTFFPAVALSAVAYGTGPGLLATVLCATLSTYFFFIPYGKFIFQFEPYTMMAVLVFCVDGLVVSLSIGIMHSYFRNYSQTLLELADSLQESQRQEAELSYQKYALDQHAIVAVTDVRGTITYVNEQFCAVSKYSREELLGQNHRLLNSGSHSKEFFTDMYQCIAHGEVWKGDICNRAKDGSLYWVSTTIVPQVEANGKPSRYVAIRTDITERKHAEQAAQAAAVAKSQFLANMSHEIRTPMNAILGLTRQVIESDLKPEQREQLNKVRKSGQALVRIINDILDFSKIEAGRLNIERVPMGIEAVLLEVTDLFSAQAEEKGLEMFVEIDPNTPLQVMSDGLRLTQVLNNLLGNAVKFTERGEIHISVASSQKDDATIMLDFRVKDTGIGILPEQIDTLFNSFVQADNSTTRKFGGSGLGLTIAKKLVQLMGGEIGIESCFGVGTTVCFSIAAGVMNEQTRKLSSYGNNLQQIKGKKILVVDDQQTSRSILSHLLKSWGLQVVEASSGAEALTRNAQAIQEGQPFHAALLDWRMPAMNGLELASHLKSTDASDIQQASVVKVLMVTGYDKQTMMAQPEAHYIDGLLTKPVAPSDLFDALLHSERRHVREIDALVMQRFDGLRVLLVEDNDLNQEVAANFLKKRGVQVTVAWHGGEAVEWVKQQAFDLVLMDLHMPVMGGLQATSLIRKLPHGGQLPIVAMTAAVLLEDRALCQRTGMNDFIAKPIEPEDLARVLKVYCRNEVESPVIEIAQPVVKPSVLDLENSLHRLDGDKALQQKLLQSFVERHQDSAVCLHALLAEQNYPAAIEYVHALKGIAANLGAMALAEVCQLIITEIRARTPSPATHADFESVLIETLRQMQQHITDYVLPKADSNDCQVSLIDTLQALQPFVLGQEVIPDALQACLLQLIALAQPWSSELQQLQAHLSNFEHPSAISLFNKIKSENRGG